MFKNKIYVLVGCAFLCTLLFNSSCNKKESNDFISTHIKKINTKDILDCLSQNKKEIISEEFYFDKQSFMYSIITKSKYYSFDLTNNTSKSYNLPNNININNASIIKNKKDYFLFFENNSIIKYDFSKNSIDTLHTKILKNDEFIINTFYRKNLILNEDTLMINYGKKKGISYIDNYSLKLITNKNITSLLKYPDYFHTNYIHYNGLIEVKHKENFFYTYQTSTYISKFNSKTKEYKEVKLNNYEEYPLFDTLKMKDMLYIYNYTYQTSQNQNIFYSNDKIILLVQKPFKNDNEVQWENYLYLYSTDLDFINKFKIKEKINIKNLICINGIIYYLDVKNNNLLSYETL